MKTKNKNLLKTGGILILGILLGWLLFGGNEAAKDQDDHEHVEAGEDQIWTCSMHPQIRQDEPGDCPICGMDLIPVANEEGAAENPATFQMSESAMKLANVATLKVGQSQAAREIRLNGKVELDERNTVTQSTHIPGRIEQLRVNFTGEQVQRGQTLALVYSPNLVTAQQELLQAARIQEAQPELFEAAKEKLRSWRIGENQINQILSTGETLDRFPITADVSGVVTEKLVDLGDYVERGSPIYQIADLSEVWVMFDLYEAQVPWVKEGSTIEFSVPSLPGETFKGEVTFIDPLLNSRSRVARARVEVDNSNGRLKPEMFASGTVETNLEDAAPNQIVAPKSAVLWTGTRSVVYVKENLGNKLGFTLREVVLGPDLGDAYIIREGLEVGEEIVVNGTFTVDAAVQLAGKPSMMSPEEGGDTGHDHDQMNMQVEAESGIGLDEQEIALLRKEIPAAYTEQFNGLIQAYLKLKNDLVEGAQGEAEEASQELLRAIQETDADLLSGHARMLWDENRNSLLEAAEQVQGAASLEEKRTHFFPLSHTLIKLVEAFGAEQSLFIDYCPMANENKGAYWISEVEEIRNPYFGASMLTCGEMVSEVK